MQICFSKSFGWLLNAVHASRTGACLAPRCPGRPARRHVYHCRQYFAHAGYGHAGGNRDYRDARSLSSNGPAGVLSAPERQGRCRSGATASRVGTLLQLRSAPRNIRRPDPVRSTPRTVTVMMATVPRDSSHHAGHDFGAGRVNHIQDLLASLVNGKPVQSNKLSIRG